MPGSDSSDTDSSVDGDQVDLGDQDDLEDDKVEHETVYLTDIEATEEDCTAGVNQIEQTLRNDLAIFNRKFNVFASLCILMAIFITYQIT